MSSLIQYTKNMDFPEAGSDTKDWDPFLRAILQMIDASVLGSLFVEPTEIPSTTLNVAVSPGSFVTRAGAYVAYAGSSSFALTASATNYLYLTAAGVLTKSTSAFATTESVRLAKVVTGAAAITSITDARVPWTSVGT